MGPTTLRHVVVAALAGALFTQVAIVGLRLAGHFPPMVPWSVPAVLVVMSVAAWIYSRGLARRVQRRVATPTEGVRALVVARSLISTGAILAGMHAVYIGHSLGQLQAQAPAQRVLMGSVMFVASLLLAWCGHLLEKACVVPESDDGGAPRDSGASNGIESDDTPGA